jgi:hypothetical protein
MIKLFRKIRKELWVDNKATSSAGRLGRYVIYAAGEILLIVIGILIALNLNNWNERRKAEALELEYLQRIYTDLKADTRYFEDQIKECDKVIRSNYQAIHEAYKEQKTQEEYSRLIDLYTHRTENLVVQNSTYLELKNSGKLSVFQNRGIKDSLIALNRDYEYAAARIKEFNDFHANIISSLKDYPRKYSKERAFIFDEPHMFDPSEWEYINEPTSQAFKDQEWAATMYLVKHREAKELHKTLLKKIGFLTQEIEAELNERKR